tara:strand:- start:36 stop:263 length:228 start_codon:yes stop_codon:yes gene_type:complete
MSKLTSKPINGATYKLFGDHCWGDFTVIAKCVHYKCTKSLSKTQKKYGYRWLTEKDNIISHNEVEKFELVLESNK